MITTNRTNPVNSSNQMAIIFDFDGTLADTKPLVLAGLNQFARLYHLPPVHEISDMRAAIFVNKLNLNFRLLGIRGAIKKIVLNNIEKNIDQIPIQNGLTECIPKLWESGFLLGVLTNNRENSVKSFLKQYELDQYFTFIKSSEDKRLALARIMNAYHLTTANLFYVGDQCSDIIATAGLAKTMAVTWGFETPDLLKVAKPNFMVSNADEMLAIFQKVMIKQNPCHYIGFADYLRKTSVEQNFSAENAQVPLEKIFANFNTRFQSKSLRDIIYLLNPTAKHNAASFLKSWCQITLLVAIDDLFDAQGEVRLDVSAALPYTKKTNKWSEDEKKQLLETYITQFILKPLAEESTISLENLTNNMRENIFSRKLNEQVIEDLQSELLKAIENGKVNRLTRFIEQYTYARNKYYLETTLRAPNRSPVITEQGRIVLDEIENLKGINTDTIRLTKCVIAVNKVIINPSTENCEKCLALGEALGKRPTYKLLGESVLNLLKAIHLAAVCVGDYVKIGLVKMGIKKENHPHQAKPIPAHHWTNLFSIKHYTPIKYQMDQLIETNNKMKP